MPLPTRCCRALSLGFLSLLLPTLALPVHAASQLQAAARLGDLSTGITTSHRLLGNPAALAMPLAADVEVLGIVARGAEGLEALRFYSSHRWPVKGYLDAQNEDPGVPVSEAGLADFAEAEATIFSWLQRGYGVELSYRATRLLQTEGSPSIWSGFDNGLGLALGHGRGLELPIPGQLTYGVGLWVHARQAGGGLANDSAGFENIVERRSLQLWSGKDRTRVFTGTRFAALWSAQPRVQVLGPVVVGAVTEDLLGGHVDGRWSPLVRGGISAGFRSSWLPRLSFNYGSWRSESPGVASARGSFYRVQEGAAASLAWEPSALRLTAGYGPTSADLALELEGPGARIGYALSLRREASRWADEGDLQHALMFAFGSMPGPRFGEEPR